MGTYKYSGNCLLYDQTRDLMFAGNDQGVFAVMQVSDGGRQRGKRKGPKIDLQVLNAGPGKGEIRKIKSMEFHRSSVSLLLSPLTYLITIAPTV